MLRKWNRFLAFLLAIALVTTTFGSDFASAKVYAVEGIEDVEPEENAEPEESSISELPFAEENPDAPVEEEAGEDTVKAEPTEDVVAEPAAGSDEAAKAAEGETPVEEEEKEIEETPDEEEPAKAEDEAEEKLVTITYKATEGGSVTVDSEEINVNAEDASFEGSEAKADEGFTFVNWTDADGEEVSTDAKFVPELLEENAEFTAVFAAAKAEEDEEAVVEKIVKVTYKADKGGRLSKYIENIDLNDPEAKFEGSEATAWDNWKFTAWVDEEGTPVSTEAIFVPADIKEDATFTAKFTKLDEMPAVEANVSTGGMIVSVVAEDGLFPEGTKVDVKAISDDEAVSAAESALGEGNVEAAKGVNITFWYEGSEIQPADSKYVHVSITLNEAIEGEDFSVVHEHDGEAEEVSDDNIESVSADGATFDANQFSVYVVAGTTGKNRIKVTFMKGTEEIATMYVKANDDMEQVIYDPSFTLGDNEVFMGWTDDPENTSDKEGFSIEKVRQAISAKLPPENDGEEITYYAMVFKGYTVTYTDKSGTSLGQHVVKIKADATGEDLNVDYTVNMAYTPEDDEHDFQGWFAVKGIENIKYIKKKDGTYYSPKENDVFENDTKLVISGDITFSVNTPAGHWLIFDENGKGATYIAPQFVETGKKPVEPTQAPNLDGNAVVDESKIKMTRNGYKFAGWYKTQYPDDVKEEDVDPAQLFDFTAEFSEKTTVYARWIPNNTASYTVLIWKEKLDGGYEFATSSVGTGNVGDSIKDTAIKVGTAGELKYVTIGEKKFGGIVSVKNGETSDPLTGFTYDETLTEDKTINPEGTAVANIYFKRMEYTVKLYVARRNKNQLQGSYVEGNNGKSGDWSLSLDRVTKINGKEPSQDGDYYYFPITAKYGADISGSWPTYAAVDSSREFISWILMKSAKMYIAQGGGQNTVKGHVGVMDEQILGDLSDSDGNYLTARYNKTNTIYNWTYYIYFKDVDGNYIKQDGKDGTVNRTVQAKSAQNGRDSQHEPPFDGYVYEKKDNYSNIGNNYTISFYYKPKEYNILYMDGVYGKGDDNEFEVEDNLSGLEFATKENILLGSSLKEYDIKPDHANKKGYLFDGWYLDESCLENNRFDFENNVMPVGGLILYAKWRKIQYRVFLHPNDGSKADSPDLDWQGQEMNFRVNYGEKISLPTGKRTGYVLMGWYRDEGRTELFNDAYVLNEDTVTEPYNWDSHMADDNMDEWGEGSTTNTDKASNRWWIRKEYNLYAKWRKVIDGADGIDVVYDLADPDAGTGTGTAVDKNSYVDNANAIAVVAVKAPEGYQFSHWVMQKYVNDKYVDVDGSVIYPGSEYKVLVANAKKEKKTDENGNDLLDDDGNNRYTYTIHLRAEYKKIGEPTPTFIPWFKNDGSKAFHIDTLPSEEAGYKDSTLLINYAVPIQGVPTDAEGHENDEFLGWAKVSMGNSADDVQAFMKNEGRWTQDITASNFIYYNKETGKFYSDAAFTNEATQVAADEAKPYEALFGVWKKTYKIEYKIVNVPKDASGNPLASEPDPITGLSNGDTRSVDARPADITGYTFDGWYASQNDFGDDTKKVTQVTINNADVTVYGHYVAIPYEYTVHYYKKNTTTPLQADKTESGKTYLATYTEEAPKFIDGYVVDGATTQTFELDKNGKEIFFYYVEREDLSYTVQYLDVDTKKEVADTVVRPNVKLGSTQTEKAIKVTGYVLDASSPEEQSITIVADETKNLITFYYKKRADLGYTVHYYEEGTTIKVADDKVVTGQIFGADVTEAAIDVNGYNALEPKTSRFTIKEENPDVIFYYARKHYDITLNAIGGSTIYNGDEHSVTGFTVSVDNPSAEGLVGRITDFIEGLVSVVAHAADVSERTGSNQFTIDGLTYTIEGVTSGANGTVAGTYPTVFSGTPVIKQDGRVVTNFGISYHTAELTIGKRNITFTSPSASKPYDGTALTAPDIAISDMPLVGGDTATFAVTGTITDPGTTKNTFTYVINGNADSYNVTKVEGDLTIEGAAPTPGPAPGPTPGPAPAPTPGPAPTPAPAPAPAPAVPAPVAAVLGATREPEAAPAAAVLGARRGRTEDTANIPARVIAVIIAAAVAATVLFTKKKDEDEEEA